MRTHHKGLLPDGRHGVLQQGEAQGREDGVERAGGKSGKEGGGVALVFFFRGGGIVWGGVLGKEGGGWC